MADPERTELLRERFQMAAESADRAANVFERDLWRAADDLADRLAAAEAALAAAREQRRLDKALISTRYDRIVALEAALAAARQERDGLRSNVEGAREILAPYAVHAAEPLIVMAENTVAALAAAQAETQPILDQWDEWHKQYAAIEAALAAARGERDRAYELVRMLERKLARGGIRG